MRCESLSNRSGSNSKHLALDLGDGLEVGVAGDQEMSLRDRLCGREVNPIGVGEFDRRLVSCICAGVMRHGWRYRRWWRVSSGSLRSRNSTISQSPADNVALSFRPDHYTPTATRSEWVYYGEACEDPDGINSKTTGGAVCAWRDYQDWDENSYFGIYVEPNWSEYTEWERRVYVDFVHTWSGYGLIGVSVGLGGLSMGFPENADRWDVKDSAAEARLTEGEEITG